MRLERELLLGLVPWVVVGAAIVAGRPAVFSQELPAASLADAPAMLARCEAADSSLEKALGLLDAGDAAHRGHINLAREDVRVASLSADSAEWPSTLGRKRQKVRRCLRSARRRLKRTARPRIAKRAGQVGKLVERAQARLSVAAAVLRDVAPPAPVEPPAARLHDVTGLPLTTDGWTDFLAMWQDAERYNDSHIVYVDATDGDDLSGRTYVAGEAGFGKSDDPFSPGEIRPFRTLQAAYSKLRSGYPDLLLLKRGEAWGESLPKWSLSGRSASELMVCGAYGPASTEPRPVVAGFTTGYGVNQPGSAFSHVAHAHLEFTDRIERENGGKGWLIEGCVLEGREGQGIYVQGLGPIRLEDVLIRRCVVAAAVSSASSGGNQGLFIKDVHRLVVEECVLDHNGFNSNGADMRTHNAYLTSGNTDIVFRRNISARASSHGVHQRAGGLMDNNLFLQNPLVQFGYSHRGSEEYGPFGGVVRNNVILDSRDIGTHARGFGLRLESLRNVEVYGNVIAHQRSGSSNVFGISYGHFSNYLQHAENVTVRQNVVHDWGADTRGAGMQVVSMDSKAIVNFVIRNNRFSQPNAVVLAIPVAEVGAFSISGNEYESHVPNPFSPGSDFEGWRSLVGDMESSHGDIAYPDADRDIQRYMASTGRLHLTYEAALGAFLAEARQQRYGHWRAEFTAEAVNAYIRAGFGMPADGLAE